MTNELVQATERSWRSFLEQYEPLRPDLYRYCRYLTRSPWDAEDLAQDALARAFATLARMGAEPEHPRAWMFRVVNNLWIDERPKPREAPAVLPEMASDARPDPQSAREAAGTLLGRLSPQERAAVVLKDVFELSLDEVAEALGTSTGAIKTALHRGRGKLTDELAPPPETAPVPGALDAFCAAFNAGDLDGLTALLLDEAVVEVVGQTTEYGPEAPRRSVLPGMLFGSRLMAGPENQLDPRLTAGVLPELPRVEARLHRGEWLLLHWYPHVNGDALRAFTRLELDGECVARIQNYFYTPETIAELGRELGVSARHNGYRGCRREAP